jgi:poly(3-hydroxybutyrate) depolymerase
MLYEAYDAQSDLLAPARSLAALGARAFGALPPGSTGRWLGRPAYAAADVVARTTLTHARPAFGIDAVTVAGERVTVREETVAETPFGGLLRFTKDTDVAQPRVLVVAPLSGHFATLLRATVQTLLADHDVFITDWRNARDVRVDDGRFGIDEYVDHVIAWLEAIGPRWARAPRLPAVRARARRRGGHGRGPQPRVPAQPHAHGRADRHAREPDGGQRPGEDRPLGWFERNVIATVPLRYKGAFRRVYPGFVQLGAFMNMNLGRHQKAFSGLFANVLHGEDARAETVRDFYEEYFAVLDLTAEFYLETVSTIFQRHALALGELEYHGRRVDPAAITRTMLLTIEGERDDICAVGQTAAAHDLCTGLRPFERRQHLQAGVGHFGVFSGRRWQREVYPLVRTMILASD